MCTTANAKFCNASSVVCPEDHVCASSYTLTNTHGAIFSMLCAPRHQCDAPGSISASSGRLQRSTTCCDTDNCTPPPPTLPDYNFQPNGLTCQTCLSVSSKWCSSMHTIDCTGEEDACLLQTSQYYGMTTRQLKRRTREHVLGIIGAKDEEDFSNLKTFPRHFKAYHYCNGSLLKVAYWIHIGTYFMWTNKISGT
ncbi:uncharacterized protein LOC120984423 isoform X1 [Bufo bufo]|uniref:uncharacterized protein LOC120984423 isoform X1 n=1 Tax=Bufo bufo TaxID=8384 RepID=UPI001ABE5915|nr:uncharacterized protein LOC120984423 isoform X1 [Bufo bufo]